MIVHLDCRSLVHGLAAGGYESKLSHRARVPLLIIDDFGLKPLRAPADEDLHNLIAQRYEHDPERLPTQRASQIAALRAFPSMVASWLNWITRGSRMGQ